MSYRKLEVDGNVFEYSIGKSHTKIRGVGAYLNEKVGKMSTSVWYNDITDEFETETNGVQVRPSDLAAFIKCNQLKVKVENKRRKA
jgi:hypothetical protein